MAAAKREFKYTSEGRLIRIKWAGGGEVPAELSGLYTSLHAAKSAGEEYLAKRDKPKNAKNSTRA